MCIKWTQNAPCLQRWFWTKCHGLHICITSSVTGSRKSIVYHNENQLCYWATFVCWLTEARTHNTTCTCNQIVLQHAKLAANWLSYFMLASCFTRLTKFFVELSFFSLWKPSNISFAIGPQTHEFVKYAKTRKVIHSFPLHSPISLSNHLAMTSSTRIS